MSRSPLRKQILIFVLFLTQWSLFQTPILARESSGISYRISVDKPGTKLFTVHCEVRGVESTQLQIDWAAWTPGYVILWNYGQHVQSLTAKGQGGKNLSVRRVSQSTWFIDTRGVPSLSISYSVRAVDPESNMGFAQAYLDSVQGWYNGAAMFPKISGFTSVSCQVEFEMPDDWDIATSMKKDPGGHGYFVRDYEELADSPVQVGTFQKKEFTTHGTRFTVVLSGSDSVNMDNLANLIRRIVDSTFKLMGSSPIDRFLFIFHAAPVGAGGLEHLHATTISVRKEEFFSKESWLKIVIAHEFFHVWNAKRIHPKTFDQYDLSRPHRTKTVWFSEGITAYYTDLILCRSGLSSKEEVYESLAKIIDLYENNPAHKRLSWEDISWYIWEPEIRQGLQVWLLPGWMIDLKIRDVSNNRFSLDDVMQFMDLWFGNPDEGFEEDGIGRIASSVAHNNLEDFFEKYVSDANSFPYKDLLSVAGLEWKFSSSQVSGIGCQIWWSGGGRNNVVWVDDSDLPASAALKIGDTILEINGTSCSSEREFETLMRGHNAGEQVNVKVRRDDVEMALSVVVTQRNVIKSYIVETLNPSPRQVFIRRGILEGLPR